MELPCRLLKVHRLGILVEGPLCSRVFLCFLFSSGRRAPGATAAAPARSQQVAPDPGHVLQPLRGPSPQGLPGQEAQVSVAAVRQGPLGWAACVLGTRGDVSRPRAAGDTGPLWGGLQPPLRTAEAWRLLVGAGRSGPWRPVRPGGHGGVAAAGTGHRGFPAKRGTASLCRGNHTSVYSGAGTREAVGAVSFPPRPPRICNKAHLSLCLRGVGTCVWNPPCQRVPPSHRRPVEPQACAPAVPTTCTWLRPGPPQPGS